MAKRLTKSFTDRQDDIGKPRGGGVNGSERNESKPALIHYLERIEIDRELENFYPEDSIEGDFEEQCLYREMEQCWPGLIPECDVCIDEKPRYPASSRSGDCNISALLKEINVKKENIRSARQVACDVIRGVDTTHQDPLKQSDKAKKRTANNRSLFSSKRKQDEATVTNAKSDFGFRGNLVSRKGAIMREKKEGCAANLAKEMENIIDENINAPTRQEAPCGLKDSTVRRKVSRVEIRMVGVSTNDDDDRNCETRDHIDGTRGKSLSAGSIGVQDCEEAPINSPPSTDSGMSERHEIAIDGESTFRRYGTMECQQDSSDIPPIAMATRGIGINCQTKDNSNGFIRLARQNIISGVKPNERGPKDMNSDVKSENIIKDTRIGYNGMEDNDRGSHCNAEIGVGRIPQVSRYISVVNGVEPIFNCKATNCSDKVDENNSSDLFHTEEVEETHRLESVWKSVASDSAECSEELSSMGPVKGRCDTGDREMSITKETGTINAKVDNHRVVKSTKSNKADSKGFYIEKRDHKKEDTDLSSDAETDSIVEISIDGSEEEDDGGSANENKWMIAIVDGERGEESSCLSFSDGSAGDCESENEIAQAVCEDYFYDDFPDHDQINREDQEKKTIKSLGYSNPLLENKGQARKSIENRTSQKCIVNGHVRRDVSRDLNSSSGKMWRKTVAEKDSDRRGSTEDRSKVICQGQGVQFRLNTKKLSENKLGKTKEEASETATVKRIVSSAKSVAVKSVVKEEKTDENAKKVRDLYKEEIENISSDLGTVENPESDLIDSELSEIFNYEPPRLSLPVTGKGHVEFNLREQGVGTEEALKMENSRLSNLLLEVEQARATTVKALLSANTVLHKVNDENTQLEGTLKMLGTDKKFLEIELHDCKEKLKNSDKEKDIFNVPKVTEFETSMVVIINSWRKEKQELLAALAKSSLRVQRVEADAEGLRVGFQRVKNQLENSNTTFNKLLEHNLQASAKVEEELRRLKAEKEMLSEKLKRNNDDSERVQKLENAIEGMKTNLELSSEEKEELLSKISHLEKKNKQCKLECEELQEQLDHSQEIIDKLAEKEEELKDRLEKETGEKEYLQDCLDETGQILLHLRNNEKKLLDEKDELEEDLEEEIQVNESLQESLKTTMQEHQSLVNRLQDMTNVHITVKASLDEASKKEKSYQQQIANLNKTNSILHYSLEKDREEKIDLQEMYDNLNSQWKLYKHEKIVENVDMTKRLDDLAEKESELRLKKEELTKENENLRESLEHEEEENDDLRKKLSRLEQWKKSNETDLEMLRRERDLSQNEASDLKKRVDDLSRGLQKEKDRYENMICTLEEAEESLEKVSRSLSETRDACLKHQKEAEEAKTSLREKTKEAQELKLELEKETGEKEKYSKRSHSLENEVAKLKKNIAEQQEELENNQMHFKRLEREKLCQRKLLDESKREFETHKERCTVNIQKLREELVGVQNKLVEKDRQALKEKENWQDAMENTAADLKLLREFFGGEMQHKTSNKGGSSLRDVLERDGGERNDIELLRKAYHRAESELLRDVTDLEGMLKTSKEEKNTVAVVQSPMSKIKLSEIKKLRDEIHELKNDLVAVRRRISDIYEEVVMLKKGEERGEIDNKTMQLGVEGIDLKLQKLNEAIFKIEADHEYVIERNSEIINKGMHLMSREFVSDEVDSSGDSAYEREERYYGRKEMSDTRLPAGDDRLKGDIDSVKKPSGMTASHYEDSGVLSGSKRYITIKATVTKDDTSIKAGGNAPTQKYVPPTSMRYPPRHPGSKQQSYNGYRSSYHSNDSSGSDRTIIDQAGKITAGQPKKPSYFAAEMSLFHHDESVAASILRRKLEGKSQLRECKSDTASIKSASSLRGSTVGRSARSGSVDDDDDENDEDSDVSVGDFRRSKTLPRKYKSRTVFSKMV